MVKSPQIRQTPYFLRVRATRTRPASPCTSPMASASSPPSSSTTSTPWARPVWISSWSWKTTPQSCCWPVWSRGRLIRRTWRRRSSIISIQSNWWVLGNLYSVVIVEKILINKRIISFSNYRDIYARQIKIQNCEKLKIFSIISFGTPWAPYESVQCVTIPESIVIHNFKLNDFLLVQIYHEAPSPTLATRIDFQNIFNKTFCSFTSRPTYIFVIVVHRR